MKHKQNGQVLIEAIVAISVATIALLGILGLVSRSLTVNNQIGEKLVASYLSAEGIEVVKNIIDTNHTNGNPWDNGIQDGSYEVTHSSTDLNVTAPGIPTLLTFENGMYGYNNSGKETIYSRVITIKKLADSVKVESNVSWKSSSGDQSIILEDYFYNWR